MKQGTDVQRAHSFDDGSAAGVLRIVQELSPLEAHILDQRGRSAIYYATDGSVYKDVNLSERIIEVIQGHVHSNNL